MKEKESVWEKFRREYDKLTFHEMQRFKSELQRNIKLQHCSKPDFFVSCLATIKKKLGRSDVKVLELGCYDGFIALEVLKKNPTLKWIGYDISYTAKERVIPELETFDFTFILLHNHFYETSFSEDFDVFFSSCTLEHLRLREVLAIFSKTARIKFQVHTIDWRRTESDTHVLEPDSHSQINSYLKTLGYTMLYASGDEKTNIFVERLT